MTAPDGLPFVLQLMGQIRLERGGVVVTLPKSRKARALLVLLALEQRPLHRDTLSAWIWPNPGDPRAALRWGLSKLRDLFGVDAEAVLRAERDMVRVDPDRITTDVARLQDLLDAGSQTPTAVLERWASSASVAAFGDLAVGTTGELEVWLEAQQERINRLQQRALGVLVDRIRDTPDKALPFARDRLARDPLSTDACTQLLSLVLAGQGRTAALATLERLRARFRDAGLDDHDLLAAWRIMAPPAAGSASGFTVPAPSIEPVVPGKPSVAVLGFDDLGGHPQGGCSHTGWAWI